MGLAAGWFVLRRCCTDTSVFLPFCSPRLFPTPPPLLLAATPAAGQAEGTAGGGFEKQGTFMTADAEETLEYKQAKMGMVFT